MPDVRLGTHLRCHKCLKKHERNYLLFGSEYKLWNNVKVVSRAGEGVKCECQNCGHTYISRSRIARIEMGVKEKERTILVQESKLLIFDIDGTIAPFNSTQPYEWFCDLLRCTQFKYALVTNQGGVACNLAGWTRKNGAYPTENEFYTRLDAILDKLPRQPTITKWCFYYNDEAGIFGTGDVWDASSRKPNPGMIISAMQYNDVKAKNTLVVGYMDSDKLAAENAGCNYMDVNVMIECAIKMVNDAKR